MANLTSVGAKAVHLTHSLWASNSCRTLTAKFAGSLLLHRIRSYQADLQQLLLITSGVLTCLLRSTRKGEIVVMSANLKTDLDKLIAAFPILNSSNAITSHQPVLVVCVAHTCNSCLVRLRCLILVTRIESHLAIDTMRQNFKGLAESAFIGMHNLRQIPAIHLGLPRKSFRSGTFCNGNYKSL